MGRRILKKEHTQEKSKVQDNGKNVQGNAVTAIAALIVRSGSPWAI